MTTLPKIAGKKPCYKELEKGRRYLWCSCGLSKSQPLCDGSHKGTEFLPIPYSTDIDGEEVLFCTCKQTRDGPHCDGSHNNLAGSYEKDDPASKENTGVPFISASDDAHAMLDGGCYVFSTDAGKKTDLNGGKFVCVISEEQGSRHQSLFFLEMGAGPCSVISFGDRHCILFVKAGEGEIVISGRAFRLEPRCGVYVRPGEVFQCTSEETLEIFMSVCPAASKPDCVEKMTNNFDVDCPERVVGIDTEQRQSMADRYFQMLVDKSIGSTVATQFIGHIPLSKAEPHRHLYEEALIILSGEGVMRTDNKKAPVKTGDVIFLPRKVRHSLQCTLEAGMDVVGVIYPGDNPSINY